MAAEGSLNSALEKALQCLSHFGLSCELRTEQTKVIYSLVSGGGDRPAILSNGFGKRPDISMTSSCQGNPDW